MLSRSRTFLALALALVVACASPTAAVRATVPPRPSVPTETPLPLPTPERRPHVFVIVMENTSLSTALEAPPIGSLASRYALATNYHAVARPSLPNYLAMTSGSTWRIADNGYYALPRGGIGEQLDAAGISWRAYMEGLTAAGCFRSPYPYALKHNPFAYYGGCPENVVPFDRLEADLAGNTPSFVWITPGLCHDGHDCALSVAGAWLSELVGRIVESAAFRDRGVLFIAWDEGNVDDPTNLLPLIVVTPNPAGRRSDLPYDHYSLLATIEDLFGLPRLGNAVGARPLTDLLSPLGP